MGGGNEAEKRGISHGLPVPTGLGPPDPPLELADIVLRPPEPDDLSHLREASGRREIEQTMWLPIPYRASEESLQDRLHGTSRAGTGEAPSARRCLPLRAKPVRSSVASACERATITPRS
jgi:hypothetical protein